MTPQREQPDWGDSPAMPGQQQRPAQAPGANQYPGFVPQQSQPTMQGGQQYRSSYVPQANTGQYEYPGAYGQPYPAAAQTPKSSNKKKLVMGVLAGLAVLVLGSGSAAAYFGYYLPNKPENYFMASLAKSFDASLKSVRFDGAIEVSGESVPKEIRGLSMSGETNSSGGVSFNATLETAYAKPKLSILAADEKSMFVKMSGISGVENILAKAAAGSDYEQLVEGIAPAIEKLNDQWYELDTTTLTDLSGVETEGTPTELTEDQKQKLIEAYKQHPFLTVTKELGDEDINGSSARHFEVVVQKEAMIEFVKSVKDIGIAGLKITDEEVASFEKEVASVDFSKYPVQVWIDKKTKYLSQLQASVTEDGVTVTGRLTLKDFNADITITKPEDAKSLMELYGEVGPELTGLYDGGGIGLDDSSMAVMSAELIAPSSANAERSDDVDAIMSLLDSYYTFYGGYPSEQDLANETWRLSNLAGIASGDFHDPNGKALNANGGYTYSTQGSVAGCMSPSDNTGTKVTLPDDMYCGTFTLTSKMTDEADIVKTSSR
jgi:hypothetical protein